MRSFSISVVIGLVASCLLAPTAARSAEPIEPPRVRKVLDKVASAAREHLDKRLETNRRRRHALDHWTYGALYTGLMAYLELTDDKAMEQTLLRVARHNRWRPGRRKYHADDHVVGQLYLGLFFRHGREEMLAPTRRRLDWILAHRSDAPLKWNAPGARNRWNWADALFMAPPTWLRMYKATGEEKYLDFMTEEWKATTDFLLDAEDHLYYRDSRFFPSEADAGEKVFWSRGVGWAFAGNARVLEMLPADHPDYELHVETFRKMAAKLVEIQKDDGLWAPSLLEPERYPAKETSGSAFFCYGLAWGLNAGLLEDARYRRAARRAWRGLVDCIDDEGVLRHVQPIGAKPEDFNPRSTGVYATGALLLAGTQMHELVGE
jgi:rhamnogalacturonyl hydrolase YesR